MTDFSRNKRMARDQKNLDAFKTALEKERIKLVDELRSFATPDPRIAGNWDAVYPKFASGETGSHSSADEEADEVEEYEVRLETEHSLESRLLEVTRALERITQGTYGLCARCGKEIPLARLEANPAAEFDIEHERNHEIKNV